MLNKKITKIVSRCVKGMTNTGKHITVRRDSPMEELCSLTNLWLPDNTGLSVFNAVPASLEAAQTAKINPAHVAMQSTLVKDMADRIVASTGYIKGTVVDAVSDCRDSVERELRETTDTESDVIIKERGMPEILYADSLPFNLDINTPVATVERCQFGVPVTLTPETTGMSKEDLTNWFDVTPNLQNYWDRVFNQYVDEGSIDADVQSMTVHDRIDYGMVMVLGATSIINKPDNVKTMGLNDLRRCCHQIRLRGKGIIRRANRHLTSSIKLGRLVLSNERNCITVNSEVYQQYLDDGGTADSIMGRSIANDSVNGKKQILDKVIEYTATYRRNSAALESASRVNKLKRTKSGLRRWVNTHMASLETAAPIDKRYGLQLAYASIEALRTSDIEDTYQCCKGIVARDLYYFTNAFEFLDYMDQAVKHNPELNPDEAAMVATLETVSDYAVGQLYLEDY